MSQYMFSSDTWQGPGTNQRLHMTLRIPSPRSTGAGISQGSFQLSFHTDFTLSPRFTSGARTVNVSSNPDPKRAVAALRQRGDGGSPPPGQHRVHRRHAVGRSLHLHEVVGLHQARGGLGGERDTSH